MKKLVVSFLLVATVALAACGSNAGSTTSNTKTSGGEVQSSLTVKDSNGEKIEVKQKPQKVVVFDNGSLDTLDALGVRIKSLVRPRRIYQTIWQNIKKWIPQADLKNLI